MISNILYMYTSVLTHDKIQRRSWSIGNGMQTKFRRTTIALARKQLRIIKQAPMEMGLMDRIVCSLIRVISSCLGQPVQVFYTYFVNMCFLVTVFFWVKLTETDFSVTYRIRLVSQEFLSCPVLSLLFASCLF